MEAVTNNTTNPLFLQAQMQQQGISAETMMLRVQMMVTKDFDEQMRNMGEKIKFLNDIKKTYRENINSIREFMSQRPNTSRKDGQHYYEASFEQLSRLFGAMHSIEYDLENKSVLGKKGFGIPDKADEHSVDLPVVNDETNTLDWAAYFSKGAKIEDPKEACEFARQVSSENNVIPVYYGYQNHLYEDGTPKFAVYVTSVEKMLEQVNNSLKDVEEKGEELSIGLNQLTSQRKAAIDSMGTLIRKIDEMKLNTVNKTGS